MKGTSQSRPPSYEAFRRVAKFDVAIGDFCLNENGFKRLVASERNLHLGDMTILFLSKARKGLVTYDAAMDLYAIMEKRSRAVDQRIEMERAMDAEMRRKIDAEECAASTFSRHSMFEKTTAIPTGSQVLSTRASMSTDFERLHGFLKGRESGTKDLGSSFFTGGGYLVNQEPFEFVYYQREPPLLLRETLMVPEFNAPAHILAKIKGLSQMREVSPKVMVNGALIEVWREWEQGNQDSTGKVGTTLPLQAVLYFYIIAGAALMDLGSYSQALAVLSQARHQFDSKVLGVDSPINHTLFICSGVAHYLSGAIEMALAEFEEAFDLAELVSRQGTSPHAAMHSVVARNNIGACQLLLGRRGEAAASFRLAVLALGGSLTLNNGVSLTALKNLDRATRLSFAFPPTSALSRPLTAPSLRPTSHFEVTAGMTADNEKLKSFLRSQVTISNTVPIRATKSDGAEAAKKAAAKGKGSKEGKKDGKGGKKNTR